MDLKKKDSSANVATFKQLMVSMKWSTAADFDLAAVYQDKSGKEGIVYFGELGDLNAFPYMQLSGDAGKDDKGGENEETMRITRLDDMKYVWILCWDYGKVQDGAPARFKGSDISLTLMDDKGKTYSVTLDTGDFGNVALIATIDNSSSVGAKLINSSKTGTLKGLNKLEQLIDVIKK